MFRRRRGGPYRPPASSAWWEADPPSPEDPDAWSSDDGPDAWPDGGPRDWDDPRGRDVRRSGGSGAWDAGQRATGTGHPTGALPDADPFGGWPAFGGGHEPDPVESVLGRRRSTDAWGAEPAGTDRARDLAEEWTPLLTHGDDCQPLGAGARPPGFGSADPVLDAVPDGHGPADRSPTRHAPVPGEPADWLDPAGTPDTLEAASLAGAFAADYLSWEEGSPHRRGQVLAQYLPSDVVGSPALLGWSGKGRQRAEFALPGAVHPDGDGRVVVDVRVRVTPYAKVGVPAEPAPAEELEVAGVPAVAPAPTARGWKSLDSYWVRLTVPVIQDRGRLVVDTWDEQLGEPGADPDPGGAGTA